MATFAPYRNEGERSVRSTIPVSIPGPFVAALCGVWRHTCSSTPRFATPSNRASSPARASSRGLTARHSVHHNTASRRASPAIVVCSKRSYPMALAMGGHHLDTVQT